LLLGQKLLGIYRFRHSCLQKIQFANRFVLVFGC
jgi:hypothetical protein